MDYGWRFRRGYLTAEDVESFAEDVESFAEDVESFAEDVSEPRADRGPQAGSPLGVVDATGS